MGAGRGGVLLAELWHYVYCIVESGERLLLTEQYNKCNARVQLSDVKLRK